MKKILFLLAFVLFSAASFAQYGRLEQLRPKGSVYILRTPKENLEKLYASTNKTDRRIASYIEFIEQRLESAREGLLTSRMPVIDIQSFTNGIKYLEKNGVDVSYYIREYFYYYPRRNSK